MDGWEIETSTGSADAFHRRAIPEHVVPSIWIHRLDGPALVLGSTQDETLVDRARALAEGVEVCRRRSGGGLVALVPGNDCWIDVVIPRESALWDADVGRAFEWVGRTWARAIATLLADDSPTHPPIEVHRGPASCRRAGQVVCFAGLGSGEVTVDGRKVVGLSQRRTRSATRFQCAMIWRWAPDAIEPYVDGQALRSVGIDLDALPVGLIRPEVIVSSAVVADRFIEALPSPGPSRE